MSKITVTGQLTLTGGQLTAKETSAAPAGPTGYALWSWGDAGNGQLGNGVAGAVDVSSPVQIGALSDWASISSSQSIHSLALKTNATLWAWGLGSSGQLGDGAAINKSSPVQVGALTDWASANAGVQHSLALKTDGSLWVWGLGSSGKLGLGNTTSYSSPVQVGDLTTWASVDGGTNFSAATKTDGTLWIWGGNALGYLGDGTVIDKSSPIQVAGTDWASVNTGSNHSLAIKTDGTLWTWGYNKYGKLGDGTISTNRSSPVQVGSLTDWSNATSVSLGRNHCLVIKSNGALWAWGRALTYGQLGDGTVIDKPSPIQIGSLTDWASVSAGRSFSLARKTDGTTWAWGRGTEGQLGDGTIIFRSSPVQIGSLTDWASLGSGNSHSLALKTP